ncbi:DAK2 domain-containing protein [Spiroplasma endosymbiont of Nephrotoma flavescens]|uniref:DAK2 domain-containing protein n=1 Tax=Spiroplasma endosymbiont of Nephrotoma flavescens TaxID=3066302 RepID=UPI00313DA4AC
MKIDAKLFKIMLISAANNLYNYHLEIDKLNVFPVPDGDTGTNMNLTMENAIKEIKKYETSSITEIANVFSRGLIMGARGNSGVILSQIFRGFSKGLVHEEFISTSDLLKAWTYAKQVAYKAVMKPVEGTILTVIRLASDDTKLETKETILPLKFMDKFLENANNALAQTPNLLPILKEVGVVDSGGFGLVKIIEGMVYSLEKGKEIKKKKNLVASDNKEVVIKLDDENFGYCTETIVILSEMKQKNFPLEKVRFSLEEQGCKSIVVVQDQDIFKVHVHSLMPGQILVYLQQFGDFQKVKIENMGLQAKKNSTEIKELRSLNNSWAIITVAAGKGLAKYFMNDLQASYVVNGGQTMNPSTDDFLKAIELVDAKDVYILPNNSNIISTAQQAAKLEKKSNVYVIPTTSIPEGMLSILSFNKEEKSAKKNFNNMKNAIKKIVSARITNAVRTTTIDGVAVKEGNYLGILDKKIYTQEADLVLVAKKLLSKMISKSSSQLVTIFIGEDAKRQDLRLIEKYIDENFDVEYEKIEGEQPVYPFIFGVE